MFALGGGALARRAHAAGAGTRVVAHLELERLNLGLGVLHQLLQGLAAPEAGRARMGTHAHAVVGHPVHADQPLRQQSCHAAGELAVQPLRVLDPEVAQRVVVDTHPAAQPAVGIVAVAQPVEFACRAHAVQRRVQPQAHQNRRVDGRAPDAAFDGTDLRVQGLKIKRLHEGPDGAGLVVGGQRRVKVAGAQFDLVAHRALHARRAFGRAPLQHSGAVQRNNQGPRTVRRCAHSIPIRS